LELTRGRRARQPIKILKRPMFGQAGIALLRKRVPLAH
jgi:hypothetical protein